MWKPTIGSDALYHSAKGTHWGKHKYIAIKNGRYIYPTKQGSKINSHDGGGGTFGNDHEGKGGKIPDYDGRGIATNDGWREKVGQKDLTDAQRTAVEAQKKGFKRTINEQDKNNERLGFSRLGKENDKVRQLALKNYAEADLKKKKDARAAKDAYQTAGYKRTNYEKAKADNKYLTRSKNYGDRLEGQRRIANAKGEYEKASKLDKQVSLADRVYSKGEMKEYDRAHGRDKRKGKKVTNPTAKKNQRRAKIESAAFKAKRVTKKAVSKGKSLFSKYFKSKTKTYVTDTFTGTRKPANHSGKTINIKKH